MPSPEAILYGHLCIDRSPETQHTEPGSPAWYIAHTFEAFDIIPAVISPYGKDYPLSWLSPVALIPAEPTTEYTLVYENHYDGNGIRTQKAFNTDGAAPINPAEVSQDVWTNARAVIVCPILDNMSLEYLAELRRQSPNALFALLPQGFYRHKDESGVITPQPWANADAIIPLFDLIFVSEQDGPDMHTTAENWSRRSSAHIIVTQAADGATVYVSGQKKHFPAFPIAQEVHPTGAGDVFSAAYMYNYLQEADHEQSFRFASAAAALHVAGQPIGISETRAFLAAH